MLDYIKIINSRNYSQQIRNTWDYSEQFFHQLKNKSHLCRLEPGFFTKKEYYNNHYTSLSINSYYLTYSFILYLYCPSYFTLFIILQNGATLLKLFKPFIVL